MAKLKGVVVKLGVTPGADIMANSFKDQFLKKGLVTRKQANKVSNAQHLSRSKKGKKAQEEDDIQKRIQQTRDEQGARKSELNRQLNEAAREKEIQGRIRQIIGQNRMEVEGEISFH